MPDEQPPHGAAATLDIARPLQRLITEDALGQLRRRDGRMAALGSEDGVLKLDWVDGVPRLLAQEHALEAVEAEARALYDRGVRHVIWAGMGGSVITVRVLREMGFCDGGDGTRIAIHPLDSTDPAALNAIVHDLAAAHGELLSDDGQTLQRSVAHTLLRDVVMVGVAMGMTSEEPITHLEWFAGLLADAGLAPADHMLAMALPGSFLERFARERGVVALPLQLDGGSGTGGRMSAPTTRVFLLSAALAMTGASSRTGELRAVLREAWALADLDGALAHPASNAFVRLAAALSAASEAGVCRMMVRLPDAWVPLLQWVEQLMEESLGKGGAGVIVFDDQPLARGAPGYRPAGTLRVRVVTRDEESIEDGAWALAQPYLASSEPHARLAALAASFLGWQVSMALFGYLHHITFAGQPAVENYKAWARTLRGKPERVQALRTATESAATSPLALLGPDHAVIPQDPGAALAGGIARAVDQKRLLYLDLTINGELPAPLARLMSAAWRHIGNDVLGVPVKVRTAPAAYHSTEQAEMDGPAGLVSLRVLAWEGEPILLGAYSRAFLCAQAIGTWEAMAEEGRACYLLCVSGRPTAATAPMEGFFDRAAASLERPLARATPDVGAAAHESDDESGGR
ncbi:MAG TPA: hypothetical protein VF818_05410 [Ktedonobacterales bacterium]